MINDFKVNKENCLTLAIVAIIDVGHIIDMSIMKLFAGDLQDFKENYKKI